MRNYFAGGAGGMHKLSYPLMKNHLIAWIDKSELKRRQDFFKKDCNILIDSGAFTAFTKGHKIDIIEYVDFINAFTEQWKDKVNSIYFINRSNKTYFLKPISHIRDYLKTEISFSEINEMIIATPRIIKDSYVLCLLLREHWRSKDLYVLLVKGAVNR